jgi:hypothetical protein
MPRRRDWLWLLAINVVVNIVADVTLNDHPDGIRPLEILYGAWPGL